LQERSQERLRETLLLLLHQLLLVHQLKPHTYQLQEQLGRCLLVQLVQQQQQGCCCCHLCRLLLLQWPLPLLLQ
jgi:hypothetical protein